MTTPQQRSSSFCLSADERCKRIDQMLLSDDESVLLCSFFGRHVAVFDVKSVTHVHTLVNKHSMLLLHQVLDYGQKVNKNIHHEIILL